jgi:hypothetical protein
MEVVEENDLRTLAAAVGEEARDGVEETEALTVRIGGRTVRLHGRQPFELSARRADDLDPRPVRRRSALLPAAADEHVAAARLGPQRELVEQPRLADPGLAGEDDERATALRRLFQRSLELSDLASAAHERIGGALTRVRVGRAR